MSMFDATGDMRDLVEQHFGNPWQLDWRRRVAAEHEGWEPSTSPQLTEDTPRFYRAAKRSLTFADVEVMVSLSGEDPDAVLLQMSNLEVEL